MPATPRLAFPAMLAGSICLAFGPWLVRLADVAPVVSAFWRMALAVGPMFALAALTRPDWRGVRPLLGVCALAAACFAADLAVWHLGIARTTLANAALLSNAASFLLPLVGYVAARAWPGRNAGIALACAAAGTALLLGRSADVSARHLAGDLFCLGAAIAYTGYLIVVDRARRTIAPLPLLTVVTAFGALFLLPAAAAAPGPFLPHDWTPLVLLALGSQVIGQGLVVYAVGHLRPIVVGLTLLVQPAIAATIGLLRFGEVPGTAEIGGAALVLVALVLVRLPERSARVAPAGRSGYTGGAMTVDDYIAATPPTRQERLRAIRAIVHRIAPQVAESIELKMPVYRVGEAYFATASQKSYLSLYIGKPQVEAMVAAVPSLKHGGGCLNIPDRTPLPSEALLEDAIRQRLFGPPAAC